MIKKINLFFIIVLISIGCTKQKPRIVEIVSENLPNPDSCLIVLPDDYTNDKIFPLVILLHGWSGNYEQWNSIINLQELSDAYDFLIACPDGFYNSWYVNSTLDSTMQYEDFFWNDFIPYLTDNYFIDTNNIFISGLSMGGHGAITLFLKNPKFFKSAGSTSGILDITKFPENWKIIDVIGKFEQNEAVWKKNSAYFLLDDLKNFNKKLFVDCGTEDFAYEVNLAFAKKCYDLDLDIKFISIHGDHNTNHWRKMLPLHFEYFSKLLD